MPSRIRSVDAEAVAKRYESGEKVASLAKEYGVCESTILNRLREAGVALKCGPAPQFNESAVCRLYVAGMPRQEVQEKTGVKNASTFYSILRKHGVPVRLQRHKRDDPVMQSRVLQLHAEGMSQTAIAREVGMNRKYVRDVLFQEATVDRKVWQEIPTVVLGMSVQEMRDSGLTIDEIAEVKQMSRLDVYNQL